jgi:osmotically-inducible protein OsmY
MHWYLAVTNTTGVNKVWNYLTVGENEDSKDIAKDAYLTSAAKTRLIAQKGVNTNNIKVVTSNKVVYLLGNNAGDPAQLKAAIVGIKGISDVHDVVNLIGQ